MAQSFQFTQLTRSCIDYIAESPVGESSVTIIFAGGFASDPVLWRAEIIALNALSTNPQSNQYIEINEKRRDGATIPIEIGLLVSIIDEPTVIKVIKMIRQYKNLHAGRHEFSGANK